MTSIEVEEAVSPSSGTGAGLLTFLDYLINRNEMVEATASALRTGCKKVLDVEGDPNAVDLRSADVDDIVRRFRNRWRGQMKDKSIDQYDQRFRQSVEMYRKWLEDDPSWRPSARTRSTAVATKRTAVNGSTMAAAAVPELTADAPSSPPAAGLVTYPLPIRPGVQGRLMLPEDLTAKEAKRIANFVSALAFEEQLAITAGEEV